MLRRVTSAPAKRMLPASGRGGAGNVVDEGGLAGAVGADQGVDFARVDGEIDASQGLHPAEGPGQAGDGEQRFSHGARRRGQRYPGGEQDDDQQQAAQTDVPVQGQPGQRLFQQEQDDGPDDAAVEGADATDDDHDEQGARLGPLQQAGTSPSRSSWRAAPGQAGQGATQGETGKAIAEHGQPRASMRASFSRMAWTTRPKRAWASRPRPNSVSARQPRTTK